MSVEKFDPLQTKRFRTRENYYQKEAIGTSYYRNETNDTGIYRNTSFSILTSSSDCKEC